MFRRAQILAVALLVHNITRSLPLVSYSPRPQIVDCLQKAYRATTKSGWEREEASVEKVAARALALSDAYAKQGTASAAHSAKLMLRSLVKKKVCGCGCGWGGVCACTLAHLRVVC